MQVISDGLGFLDYQRWPTSTRYIAEKSRSQQLRRRNPTNPTTTPSNKAHRSAVAPGVAAHPAQVPVPQRDSRFSVPLGRLAWQTLTVFCPPPTVAQTTI